MVSLYRIVLALHIIGVISWMAGILYLYRLFIYHTDETNQPTKDRFVTMENRLWKIITQPAMYFSVIMGGWMIVLNPSLLDHHWFQAKLVLAMFLIGATQMASQFKQRLQEGSSSIPSRTFRILNELPTLLMIGIVFLVILRPF